MFQAQADLRDVNLITEYDDEATSNSESSSKSSTEAMTGKEPIYAVVNLKNKYARRAKKIEIDENIFVKERPNSFHVISGDYEEVRSLLNKFNVYTKFKVIHFVGRYCISMAVRKESKTMKIFTNRWADSIFPSFTYSQLTNCA